MKHRITLAAAVLLGVLTFGRGAQAEGDTIVKSPVLRGQGPHYTMLGTSNCPFGTGYVDTLDVGGLTFPGITNNVAIGWANAGAGEAMDFLANSNVVGSIVWQPGYFSVVGEGAFGLTLDLGTAELFNQGTAQLLVQSNDGITLQNQNGTLALGADGNVTTTAATVRGPAHYTVLGSPTYPFAGVYADQLNGGRPPGTNAVAGSQQFVLWQTNLIVWSASNFIGTFPQLESVNFNGGSAGGGGMVPPTNVTENIMVSNGPAGWSVLGNATYTNTVSVAVVGGGGGAGYLTLYGVDHPELLNTTNYFFGQYCQFPAPVNPSDPATKAYVDTAIQNAGWAQFTGFTDTNGNYHYAYQRSGTTLLDLVSGFNWFPLAAARSTTNLLLTTAVTNLQAGWALQWTTNVALLNGWTPYTNYTAATNTGNVTFTIGINPAWTAAFFRGTYGAAYAVNLGAQLLFQTNLARPTLPPGMCCTWVSNGWMYYLTAQHPNGLLLTPP